MEIEKLYHKLWDQIAKMQVCYVESFKEISVEKDSEEVFKTMVQKFLCEKSIELDQIISRSQMMLQELEEKKISFKDAKAAAHHQH